MVLVIIFPHHRQMANDDANKEIEDHEGSKSSTGTLVTAIIALLLALVGIGLAILAMSNVPDAFSWKGASYATASAFATSDLTSANKAANIISYGSTSATGPIAVDVSTWKGNANKRVLRIVNIGVWNTTKTTQYPVNVTGMASGVIYSTGSGASIAGAAPTKIVLQAGDYVEFIQNKDTGPTYIGMGLANGNVASSGFA